MNIVMLNGSWLCLLFLTAYASRGDAGAMMLDAYYLAVSETDPCVRECMLALLESVRIKYVTAECFLIFEPYSLSCGRHG
jgi:hypothetical protein